MSAVKIHTPPVRLAKLLRTPGGLPVAEALQKAGAGLESLRGECLSELDQVLQAAEAIAARAGGEYDAELTAELYGVVSTPIGVAGVCGLQSVETALLSLCDLLDRLKAKGGWDANAVAVHLRAFRLLLHTEAAKDDAGTRAILDGLRKVSQRYAGEEAPAGK
ncbi:MAG: hypothetical protein ACK41C_07820 [Phenylobacterium sp.]|uniref:hypothetical protein n=1 Tax=Phenylobacterium sp. TaxID=1871053 RepID=UPI00391C4E48